MARKRYPSDRAWCERRKQKLHEHEISNGVELGLGQVRVSDFVKGKILSGRTKALIINEKLVLFHKNTEGYWVNNSTFHKEILLHREIIKKELGLTDEDLIGKEIHHIDKNKDHNEIQNLKIISKSEHARHHLVSTRIKIKKICEWCGEEYETYINKSRFCSSKCDHKWRYHNERKLQLDTRICKNCGKEFTCNKYKPTKFCSLSCATTFRYKK